MHLYSQKDPAYGYMKLGPSKLTVNGFGCFLCSIATLYQRRPELLLNVLGAFKPTGDLISSRLAAFCQGTASPASNTPPKGWCIAVTNFYKDAGYPTHFFCANYQTKEQIDPLDLPARVEPLTYPVIQWRPFTNIVLDTSIPILPPIFTDIETNHWSTPAIEYMKLNGIMKGYDDGSFRPSQPVTREELAQVIYNLERIRLDEI